ncbi:hypothetical protein HanPSC8_Chr10g0408911 [Helianthus annuus]|nr:hypothetical protein HanPSC8_Chr10g0408911 [Helianthus annuus]
MGMVFLYTTQVPQYLEGENYVFSGGREVINVFSILCIIEHFSYTGHALEKQQDMGVGNVGFAPVVIDCEERLLLGRRRRLKG